MAEEKEKPLTREDVLRLIEENGGKAVGLDFSDRKFVDAIDLSGLDLSGIRLINAQLFRANFNGSNLDGTIMQKANLQYATFNRFASKPASLKAVSFQSAHLENAAFREADLTGAQFQGVPLPLTESQKAQFVGALWELLPAYLGSTDFRSANLFLANFKGCYFYGTKLQGAYIRGADIFDAHLEQANWGKYILGEETKKDELHFAEDYYRQLKKWYADAGMYDIAGEFFFSEMTARRKALDWWPNPFPRAWSKFLSLICGYGEKPLRVIGWAALVVLGLAVIYFIIGSSWGWNFWDSLYFSAVSFTALGYGSWLQVTNDWIRGIGAFESFVGVFSMALFLVTFTRKMTR